MSIHINHLGQPIGYPLESWRASPTPEPVILEGRFCRLEPVNPASHGKELYEAFKLSKDQRNWTYLLNSPSRNAATRLGFQFEGIFRQCLVYKGRNRDTAWFSIIDSEWAELKKRFQNWLSPDNFDAQGNQIKKLCEC